VKKELDRSTIRLFKALIVSNKNTSIKASSKLLKETIRRGIIFSPEVLNEYNEDYLLQLINEIGLTPEQINSSFHKSWLKIRDASIEQLVMEQVIHYFTTYGFEALGIYNKDSVYIPSEKLEIPEVNEDLKLIIIKGYTKEELKNKLINLINSGIALKDNTLNDLIEIALSVNLKDNEIEGIKNKEMRAILYNSLGLIPSNPVEFLRYVIYNTTEESLLIKSNVLITKIKSQKNIKAIKLFEDYKNQYGLENLAKIFYRFKPLFLAFRTNAKLKKIINRIRRLAKKYHEPMPVDYLNTVTERIKKGKDLNELSNELNKVNIFRKIRLAYALKFRLTDSDSIVYRIRNGKGFATSFSFDKKEEVKNALDIVLNSISKDLNVKDKKIYFPSNVSYALPLSEKQFIGNLPFGSYIDIPANIIFGVYWKNLKLKRVDLDLSIIDVKGNKLGWDSNYRYNGHTFFSGDITDAPNGATEMFYLNKQNSEYLVYLNYYNFDSNIVPFKIIIANEKPENFGKSYMVNPNNIITIINSEIKVPQEVLGLLISEEERHRFYFFENSLGYKISSNASHTTELLNFYKKYYCNAISLKEILLKAGAKIINKEEEADIDLALDKIEKDTIINLVKSKSGSY